MFILFFWGALGMVVKFIASLTSLSLSPKRATFGFSKTLLLPSMASALGSKEFVAHGVVVTLQLGLLTVHRLI